MHSNLLFEPRHGPRMQQFLEEPQRASTPLAESINNESNQAENGSEQAEQPVIKMCFLILAKSIS